MGGGIAGCLAARDIADQGFIIGLQVQVTLVDPKTYFEDMPSVLRAIMDLSEARASAILLWLRWQGGMLCCLCFCHEF